MGKTISKARQSIRTLRNDREARGYASIADLEVSNTQMEMSIRIPDSPEGGSFRFDLHCSRNAIHVICLGTKFPEGTEGSTEMESSAFARFPAWEEYYFSFNESTFISEDPVETSD
ncbi:MAG: hypothetical protein CMN76_01140 [Spirochaetaceae bacterium]|nr:hypothetical protein [Spirochaetaceae bacterium]